MKAQTLLLLLIILVASCESNSGRRAYVAPLPLEKVVIIDSELGSVSDNYVRYKVKRINKGVVTFITLMKSDGGRFEKGDTIFYKFK